MFHYANSKHRGSTYSVITLQRLVYVFVATSRIVFVVQVAAGGCAHSTWCNEAIGVMAAEPIGVSKIDAVTVNGHDSL